MQRLGIADTVELPILCVSDLIVCEPGIVLRWSGGWIFRRWLPLAVWGWMSWMILLQNPPRNTSLCFFLTWPLALGRFQQGVLVGNPSWVMGPEYPLNFRWPLLYGVSLTVYWRHPPCLWEFRMVSAKYSWPPSITMGVGVVVVVLFSVVGWACFRKEAWKVGEMQYMGWVVARGSMTQSSFDV